MNIDFKGEFTRKEKLFITKHLKNTIKHNRKYDNFLENVEKDFNEFERNRNFVIFIKDKDSLEVIKDC